MSKRVIGIIILCILAVAGFLWLTRPDPGSSSLGQPTNHIFGQGAKNVTLIEYGDFQCPACAVYYPIVEAVTEKYKADIFFQFRNFPLESIHQNARAAARAAEAADMQGKFWEMYDVLYQSQDSWKNVSDPLSFFTAYARQIGVADLEKFATDYRSTVVNAIINADLKEAQKLGASSTPTFVLDGVTLKDNPRDLEAFNKLIDDAIAKKAQ